MRTEWKMKAAAIVIALGALAVASHAVQAVEEIREPASYTSYSSAGVITISRTLGRCSLGKCC